VGVRGALHLRDLDERLVPHALLDVRRAERLSGPVGQREHRAVRAVRVVRNREALDAPGAKAVHPVPEVLGVLRVEPREGNGGQHLVVAEDDVAVQVAPLVGRGGVLVGHEGREAARVVVPARRIHDVAPGGLRHLAHQLLVHGAVLDPEAHSGQEAAEGADALGDARLAEVVLRVQVVEHVRAGDLRGLGRRVGGLAGEPQEHRVVGHRVEVERLREPDLEPGRMADRLALGETVGVVGRRERPEREGVEGVRGVDVEIAEERLAVGLPLLAEVEELVPDLEIREAARAEGGGLPVGHGVDGFVVGATREEAERECGDQGDRDAALHGVAA
jgi:hypothetical protein